MTCKAKKKYLGVRLRFLDDYLNHPSIYSSIHSFPIWDEIFSSRGGLQNDLTTPLCGVKKGKKKKERKKERKRRSAEGSSLEFSRLACQAFNDEGGGAAGVVCTG